MADASQVLGSPEVAGTFLNPKGTLKKKATASAGRAVGGLVGAVGSNLAQSHQKQEGTTPDFGQVGYLAVTADELALVRGKIGAIKPKIRDEVLARRPRSDVQSVELEGGKLIKADLTIQFADGGAWEFEVPKVYRKTADRLVQELSPG
jgi:hypothetical protein